MEAMMYHYGFQVRASTWAASIAAALGLAGCVNYADLNDRAVLAGIEAKPKQDSYTELTPIQGDALPVPQTTR
jgi:hypothetical protein